MGCFLVLINQGKVNGYYQFGHSYPNWCGSLHIYWNSWQMIILGITLSCVINCVNKDNWSTLMKSLKPEAQGLNINAMTFIQLLNIIFDGIKSIVLAILETASIYKMHQEDIVAKVQDLPLCSQVCDCSRSGWGWNV